MELRQQNNSDEIQELLDAYHDGYLNEQILERIIHKIARKHARQEANRNNIWTFSAVVATLLVQLLGGNVFPTLRVALSGVSQSSQAPSLHAFQPHSPTSEIATFAPLKIETPFFIDNSPPGAWDFTLKRDLAVDVEIPSPCAGVVRRVYFQGKTGNLRTGRGGGQIVEINCLEGSIDGQAYGWVLGHLQKNPPVRVGQLLRKGETVGIQGTTGRTSGHHVHTQLHYQKTWQRIEDRSLTRPLVEDYLSFLQTGRG